MDFNPLQDLLNTGLIIIEIGLVYGSKHLEAKYADSRLFWTAWPCFSRMTYKTLVELF